ncbi:homeobox protein NANOG [Erinaceus europaeus]|uniref:Homeobox protein NANOG n=1 Tax=Erinaceus europaeus TaxID=9365 RepID=A0A1S3AN16_ERIEU|nr:homeobox protein NANOG [Erinaceus europaeus]
MSVDNACPRIPPCPESCSSGGSSPKPEIHSSEEKQAFVHESSEAAHLETASPLPSYMDLPAHESPDSSTSPKAKMLPSEEKSTTMEPELPVPPPVKKQKSRTVFSQSQLCVLNDRFQKQKYLSLQQMQELSTTLNLSYKQVKTWFQNQRMKSKRWLKNSSITQVSGPLEYPSFYPYPHPQGCLVNTPENLPMWNIPNWNNPPWTNQPWNPSQNWYSHAWNNQTWDNQLWPDPAYTCGEESPPLLTQFQQHFSPSDFDTIWDPSGESYSYTQQTGYFNTEQAMDFFLNCPPNTLSQDV